MNSLHIVLAPDSFKGSASALDVAHALGEGLQQALPQARLTLAPMADGGEGTLDCVAAACAGHWRHCSLNAIHGRAIEAPWYHTDEGRAVVESASVLGLPLVEATADAPALRARSSQALGELLRTILDDGVRDIAVGLGGSACNDAGLGLLVALGAVARDRDGQVIAPSMNGLLALATLDLDDLDPRLADTCITALCDVDNPLLGSQGASRVYGPQKGLSNDEIEAVEAAFQRLAGQCPEHADTTAPGSGAAGGLGFALAVLGAELAPGANTLMDMTGLRAVLDDADLVITGEGRSDSQTLSGKLPLAIARAAAPTPTVLVSGAVAEDARATLETHFAACHTLVERAGSVDAACADPLHWLRLAAREIGDTALSLADR
ncbi:glycerate kinase [Salinisphaera aquimarina]|uniref:Glycerate kinase n=1 Tax=Salinisphaera aquimarina TaxID=2094031 RepID=A0ABV7ERM7_9GAMM